MILYSLERGAHLLYTVWCVLLRHFGEGGLRHSYYPHNLIHLYNWATDRIRQCDYPRLSHLEMNILWTFWTVQFPCCVSYVSLYVLIFDGENKTHTCRSSMLISLASPIPAINISLGEKVTWQPWHGKSTDFFSQKEQCSNPQGLTYYLWDL